MSFIDQLKKCKRGPQVILPKDAGSIAAITGVSSGWKCLDAGGGSGFLSLFLGNLVRPGGKVSAYEKPQKTKKKIGKWFLIVLVAFTLLFIGLLIAFLLST